MTSVQIVLVALASLCSYEGLSNLYFYFRRRQELQSFSFALTSLGVAAYQVSCYGLYGAQSFADGMYWQRMQFLSLNIVSISIIWFMHHLNAIRSKSFPRYMGFLFALLLSITLFLDVDDLFIQSHTSPRILRWGHLSMTLFEQEPGLILRIQFLGMFVALLVSLGLLFVNRRRLSIGQEPLRTLFIASMLLYMGAALNDILVGEFILHSFYLLEYSYAFVLMFMTLLLMHHRLKNITQLEVLNHSLEHRVQARTHELEEANERLLSLSFTDPLTNLANRRDMLRHFQMERVRVERSLFSSNKSLQKASFCIALLDLDHFKNFNDTHGHECGDHVLIEFSNRIKKTLRAQDMVGRWGGEEFLVIMPHTDGPGAVNALLKIRANLAETPIFYQNQPLTITFSAGIVEYSNPAEGLDGPLKKADDALYASKKAGRDRITLAPLGG